MSGFTFFAPTTVAKITVSPHEAMIAPSACLATLPVSKLIFFPATSISFLYTLNISFPFRFVSFHSVLSSLTFYFLKFNFDSTFLYEFILFFFKYSNNFFLLFTALNNPTEECLSFLNCLICFERVSIFSVSKAIWISEDPVSLSCIASSCAFLFIPCFPIYVFVLLSFLFFPHTQKTRLF